MASEAQAVRYEQLLDMQERGLVSGLRTEVAYPLVINNRKICTYRADFVYQWHGDEIRDPRGESITEEVKGLETPEWKLKLKLFEAVMGYSIRVIRLPRGEKQWAQQDPDLVAQMVGKKSKFSEWIRLAYRDRIPS